MAQDHGAMPDVSGEWEMSVEGGFGMLELTVDGYNISGFITLGDHGRLAVHSAKFDGHELYFEMSMEEVTLVFRGRVNGDEYVGEISGPHEMPNMVFTAKRTSR
ncbi:MAG TPA: hypothetical protein DC060_11575 [Gemmatimonadetes bacterium]|nr:hypothetical protein [Gemmatimonadota bacterium]